MTNRIFGRSKSNFTCRSSLRTFNFALKQQLVFAAEIDAELMELERQFIGKSCMSSSAQQGLGNTPPSPDPPSDGCTYDDFGLVEGLELDVRWM